MDSNDRSASDTARRPRLRVPDRSHAVWRRLIAVGVVLAAVGLAFAVRAAHRPAPPQPAAVPASWQRPVVPAADLVGSAGVRLTRVTVTGDGGLLDVRYQVVDPAKAHALHEPGTPPAVVAEDSGLVISELFMGHSHTGEYRTSATYYLVFTNPGGWVHRGSKVTVLLGNAQVEHVVVS